MCLWDRAARAYEAERGPRVGEGQSENGVGCDWGVNRWW